MNSNGNAVAKLNYTHQACVETILANPGISQGQLAALFGYTQAWLCRVMQSDAFREFFEERRLELVDPTLVLTIEERLKGIAARATDVIQEKLDAQPTGEFALKALEISSRALGYGAKPMGPQLQVNTFLVHAPPKAADSKAWLDQYGPPVIESRSGPAGQSPVTLVPVDGE
jgi:hypothetical protein